MQSQALPGAWGRVCHTSRNMELNAAGNSITLDSGYCARGCAKFHTAQNDH